MKIRRLLSSPVGVAQRSVGAAPAAAAPKDDQVTIVTPSTVPSQKDNGYRATNSVITTGICTKIHATPISINVVTRELMGDLGSGTMIPALQFTSGITTDARDLDQNYSRGFMAPKLVNGLLGLIRNPTPAFFERIEIVKGPNSVFFGRVAPGCLVNAVTLQPHGRSEGIVPASYGSYDHSSALPCSTRPSFSPTASLSAMPGSGWTAATAT